MSTLHTIFDWTLEAGLRASLLVPVVLTAQRLLRRRLPANWRYALWLPVLVALVVPALPILPHSVIRIMSESDDVAAIPSAPVAPLETAPAPLAVAEAPSPAVVAPVLPAPMPELMETRRAAAVPETTAVISLDWREMAVWAWLVSAVVGGMFVLGSFAMTLRRVRRALLPVEPALSDRVERLSRAAGLRRAPRVWRSSAVTSPAVCGVWRPVLLLNEGFEEHLTEDEVDMVLRHELAHIRRGDLIVNALQCGLLALHWFNPLMWLAFFRVRADREAACDEAVLRGESTSRRAAYGHALLKMETSFAPSGLCLGFVGILQGRGTLRTRIQSIIARRKLNVITATVVATGIALFALAGITGVGAAPGPGDAANPVTTRKTAVKNSTGGAMKTVRLVVQEYQGAKTFSRDAGSLAPGNSLAVPHDLQDSKWKLTYTLDGVPKEHSATYVDLWKGDSWIIEVWPDGEIRSGYDTGNPLPAPRRLKAHAAAKQAKTVADARQVVMGCIVYAVDHDGKFPPTLEALMPKYLGPKSASLLYADPNGKKGSRWEYRAGLRTTDDAREILLKSRALHDGKPIVARVDGSVVAVRENPPGVAPDRNGNAPAGKNPAVTAARDDVPKAARGEIIRWPSGRAFTVPANRSLEIFRNEYRASATKGMINSPNLSLFDHEDAYFGCGIDYKVKMFYKGTKAGKDYYLLKISYPENDKTRTVSRQLVYEGKEVEVFRDDVRRIVVRPQTVNFADDLSKDGAENSTTGRPSGRDARLPDLAKAFPGEQLFTQTKIKAMESYGYATDLPFEVLKKKLTTFLGEGWKETEVDPSIIKDIKRQNADFLGNANFTSPAFPKVHIFLTQMKQELDGKKSVASIMIGGIEKNGGR